MMLKNSLALSIALSLSSLANSATVLPADVVAGTTFNWSTGADGFYNTADDFNAQWGEIGWANGGTATVTADNPKSGDGSLKLASNGSASAKAGIAYYPAGQEGFGTLKSITAASFDWMRAAGSAATDGSPVMRIFLFTPGTDTHVGTLLWQAANDGLTVTDDTWVTTNVLSGKVWNAKGNGGLPVIPPGTNFADLQADTTYGPLVVRAVEIGFGTGGWSANYVGAADNVVFTGDKATVTSNFEMSKPQFNVKVTADSNGSTDQGATQLVDEDGALVVTITPKAGFEVDTVTGCGGTLVGNVYTTGAVTADCEVIVSFKQAAITTPPVATAPQSVPTLGQWGVMLLGSLMAGFAALRLRSRK